MKLLKQITAVMAALMIVFNLSFINTSAAMAAPVAGEELAAFLTELLLGAGHSQSEIDGMSIYDMQNTVKKDIETNVININTNVPSYKGPYMPTPDGVSLLGTAALLDWLANDPNNVLGRQIIANAVNDFISDDDVLSDTPNYFTPQSTTDLMGSGAMMKRVDSSTMTFLNTWDYIVIEPLEGDKVKVHFHTDSVTKAYQVINGVIGEPSEQNIPYTYLILDYVDGCFYYEHTKATTFYGDVRTIDGEPFPTDDEYQYQLGALPDGTVVTPDMLNPDGTVTVDGVTYDPVDYLDPDNLTDEGKHALIDAIADAISNTLVVADDKPIVDADDITVEVAEELQDYAVPVGIANVFPFCIPWDIVRGFQLLNRPAVTPKFEIPFNIPEFGLFPGVDNSITLDFSKYDTYIQIFRWFQLIGFSFLLCKLSLTRVKGAGA